MLTKIKDWWNTRWTKGFDKLDNSTKIAFCMTILHSVLKSNPGKAIAYVMDGQVISVTMEPLDMDNLRDKLTVDDNSTVH